MTHNKLSRYHPYLNHAIFPYFKVELMSVSWWFFLFFLNQYCYFLFCVLAGSAQSGSWYLLVCPESIFLFQSHLPIGRQLQAQKKRSCVSPGARQNEQMNYIAKVYFHFFAGAKSGKGWNSLCFIWSSVQLGSVIGLLTHGIAREFSLSYSLSFFFFLYFSLCL